MNLVRKIHRVFVKTQRELRKRRKVTVVVFAGLTLALAPGVLKIKQLLAVEDYLSAEFKGYHELTELKEQFPENLNLTANFTKLNGQPFSPEDLCNIHKWISYAGMNFPEIISSYSVFSWRRSVVDRGRVYFPRVLEPCATDASLSQAENVPGRATLYDLKTPSLTVQLDIKYEDDETDGKNFHPEAFWKVSKFTENYWAPLRASNSIGIQWIGNGPYESYMEEGIQKSQWMNLLGFVLIMGLFYLVFGTWRSGAVFFFSLLLTYVITYEAMGWFQIPIDQLTSCLPIFILIATLEDFIYLSFYQQTHPRAHWRRSFRALVTPSFFTSLTTFIGFGSLMVSSLTVIRKFGAICAFSSMVEWAMLFFFVPLLAEKFPALRTWVKADRRQPWLDRLGRKNPFPRWFARSLLLLVAVSPLMIREIPVRDQPEKIFPTQHPLRQAIQAYYDHRSILTSASVVFNPEASDVTKMRLLNLLKQNPLVTEIEQGRAEEGFLLEQLPENLRKAASNFWKSSPAGARLFSTNGYERVIVYLNSSDHLQVDELANSIRKSCNAECFPAGVIFAYAEFSRAVFKTLFESLFLSIGLVGMVLWFLCLQMRIPKPGLIILSAFWGASIVLALVGVFQVGINFASCIFFSVLAGITGDNTVQFIFGRYSKKESASLSDSLNHLGSGAILVSSAMMLASGVLVFSPFTSIRKLVILMAIGFLTGLIGDLWLLRGLIVDPKEHVS